MFCFSFFVLKGGGALDCHYFCLVFFLFQYKIDNISFPTLSLVTEVPVAVSTRGIVTLKTTVTTDEAHYYYHYHSYKWRNDRSIERTNEPTNEQLFNIHSVIERKWSRSRRRFRLAVVTCRDSDHHHHCRPKEN